MKIIFVLILTILSFNSFACVTPQTEPEGEGFWAKTNLQFRCQNNTLRQRQWISMDTDRASYEITALEGYDGKGHAEYYLCRRVQEDGSWILSSQQDPFTDFFKDYYGPLVEFLVTKGLKVEVFESYPVCDELDPSFIADVRKNRGLD